MREFPASSFEESCQLPCWSRQERPTVQLYWVKLPVCVCTSRLQMATWIWVDPSEKHLKDITGGRFSDVPLPVASGTDAVPFASLTGCSEGDVVPSTGVVPSDSISFGSAVAEPFFLTMLPSPFTVVTE